MIRVSPNRAETVSPARCGSIARVALLLCAMLSAQAFAHEGHDHGAEPTVQQQPLAPRLTHESDKLEAVALLQGPNLLVYADDHASNAPATGLRVDVRSGGRLVQALEIEPGLYRADLQIEPKAEEVQLEVSLNGEGIAEHFGGKLAVDESADALAKPASNTAFIAVAGGAVLLLVIAGAWALRKRRSA